MRVAGTGQAALEGRGSDGVEQVMEDLRRDDQKETGRVESFSDGVIAIAITLLILEIKVPKADEIASASLFAKLLDLWPSFSSGITTGRMENLRDSHHGMLKGEGT
jgi:Endosomal/lysosomal potassium channel TMEM175